jgi:hypothetical protein
MNWSPRQELHLHWLRSKRSASALGYVGIKWRSRQEFRLQPPRSKRGTLYIELRERLEIRADSAAKIIRLPVLPRSSLAYKASA